MTATDSLRDEVRRKYAEAAVAVAEGSGCGCGSGACCDGDASEDFGRAGSASDGSNGSPPVQCGATYSGGGT